MSVSAQINPLPQDLWNRILADCDFIGLKKARLVSKMFIDIVEKGSMFILAHFRLDRKENGHFRRIICLESLICQLTVNISPEQEHVKVPFHFGLEDYYMRNGINQCDYWTPEIDPTNPAELQLENNKKKAFNNQRILIHNKCHELPFSVSLSTFLATAQSFISGSDSDKKLTIRKMTFMTPHIFPDHLAKKDFNDLINRNLDDLQLALSYDPIKAKKLLEANFSTLKSDEIEYIIIFYLLNLDVEGLQHLLTLIKKNCWVPDPQLERYYPGFQNLLANSLDDQIEVFVKFLKLFKTEIFYLTQKQISNHVAENGHVEILKKLDEHDLHYGSCHHAKNAEIANILFSSNKFSIEMPLYDRSPLLTAILKSNHDVAEFLISKGAWVYDNWQDYLTFLGLSLLRKRLSSYTNNPDTFKLLVQGVSISNLVKFLIPTSFKSLNEEKLLKWIALKELVYRVVCFAAKVLAILAAGMIAAVAFAYFVEIRHGNIRQQPLVF